MNKSYKIVAAILFIATVVLLSLQFNSNYFKLTNQNFFDNFQKDTEGFVVGRLIVSERSGLFSHGGLTGLYTDVPENTDINVYQYKIYKEDLTVNSYGTYDSQIGGQSFLFATIDKVFGLDNPTGVSSLHLVNSILTAIIFGIFVLWVYFYFDLIPSLVLLFLMINSEWLTVFGRNLWWVLWSFYLPMIALLYYYKIGKGKITLSKLYLVSLLAVFVKCFFNGYEYITTTLVMASIPLFFYAIYNQWSLKEFFKQFLIFSSGAISGLFLSFLFLVLQISAVKSSFQQGIDHIIFSFLKRTSGASEKIPEAYHASLNSSIGDVISNYWNGVAFDFNSIVNITYKGLLVYTFGEVITIFMFMSLIAFLPKEVCNTLFKNRNLNKALAFATWISILAPFSWFIIFKGHSYIHTHMNFIVWYMPFFLFGFLLIGVVFSSFLKDFIRYCQNTINRKISNTVN